MKSYLFLILLLAAAPSPRWGRVSGEVPGLSLRGSGCHVDLMAPDGGVICSAVVRPLPPCTSLLILTNTSDGGMVGEKTFLGSSCPPPRLNSYSAGNGSFFVEHNGTVRSVICDNASRCQRNSHRAAILKCCREDRSLQRMGLCQVRAEAGVCMEAK